MSDVQHVAKALAQLLSIDTSHLNILSSDYERNARVSELIPTDGQCHRIRYSIGWSREFNCCTSEAISSQQMRRFLTDMKIISHNSGDNVLAPLPIDGNRSDFNSRTYSHSHVDITEVGL